VFSSVCPETGEICSLIMHHADSEAINIFLKTLSEQQQDELIYYAGTNTSSIRTDILNLMTCIILSNLQNYCIEYLIV